MNVSWFSAGVSSAVSTILATRTAPDITVIEVEIPDHHPDSARFSRDVERHLGRPVVKIRSAKYKDVEDVVLKCGFINGPRGAACTDRLKRQPRKTWEKENPGAHVYFWGFDASPREKDRALRLQDAMPEHEHKFPLVEAGMTKADAHGFLEKLGIKRPAMYDLGFPNNNCRGCLKGGMGYWRLVRDTLPEVFAARVELEKKVGRTCINGVALSDIGDRGRDLSPIVQECGINCEIPSLSLEDLI